MKKLFFVFTFIFASSIAWSQSEFARDLMNTPKKEINLKEIELEVMLPSSEYYYPVLYERYEKGDTTLTLDDYRHLYYGYIYNVDYNPLDEPKYVDSLAYMLNKSGGVFLATDAGRAIKYIDSILYERPFSLKFLNIMTYLYLEKVRDEKKGMEYSYKFNMLLATIFSSGNGLTKESPWRVTYRVDAQTVLSFIGAEVARRNYITYSIEYYYLKERQGDVRGYYFDFEPIYSRPTEPKGKRTLEINNLPTKKYRKKGNFY